MGEQRITPHIWCQGNAEEVGRFYASIFPDASSRVESRYPETGLLDFQRDLAGQALTVSVEIRGYRLILLNAGAEFRPGPSISFMVNFDPLIFDGDEGAARATLGAIWRELGEGGQELMPLGEYPFSKRYGWVQDRYGVNWQLMLTDPAGEPRPFIIPALMFDGAAQNHARQAAEAYVELFAASPGSVGDAALGTLAPYGTPTGKASAEALAFGEFRVGDQWFAVMDNGSGNDFGFDCGVSLEVTCADQAEIDRLWSVLSAEPHAEQCGWAQDRFGVRWQIVPADMERLMERPGAFEHMMEMKKIIIDEL